MKTPASDEPAPTSDIGSPRVSRKESKGDSPKKDSRSDDVPPRKKSDEMSKGDEVPPRKKSDEKKKSNELLKKKVEAFKKKKSADATTADPENFSTLSRDDIDAVSDIDSIISVDDIFSHGEEDDVPDKATLTTVGTGGTIATVGTGGTAVAKPPAADARKPRPPVQPSSDPYFRPQPPAYQHLAKPTDVRHGLNGGVQDRKIYQADKQPRNKRPFYPPRPPPMIGKRGPCTMEKRWRVDIAHDSLDFLKARDWHLWQPERMNIRYEFPENYTLPATANIHDTQVVVSAEDSLGCALRILAENPLRHFGALSDIPAVLNMAHWRARGGGFLHGARAQEEDLCRCTDLYMTLQSADYPLPEFGVNYSFPISVLRGSKHTNYRFLKSSAYDPVHFPQIGVLSAAAYKDPTVDEDFRRKMRRKVDNLFTAALASGHRIIILSAWGCGAFNNPPEEISRIFKQSLQWRFRGRFKQVIFALGTRQSDQNLGPLAVAFLNTFGTKMYRPPRGLNLDPVPTLIVPGTESGGLQPGDTIIS